jgi:hypothetical protein
MLEKKISVKGLADFMTAGPAKQRTILRDYKYQDEDEPRAKIMHYREAREAIARFHRGDEGAAWLEKQAARLDAQAVAAGGQRGRRLRDNAIALQWYAVNFSMRRFDVLADLKFRLGYGDVVVTVVPDLHVREGTREKIIKLGFNKSAPKDMTVKIIAQTLFEAAELRGMALPSSAVLFLDVARGQEYRGARLGSRMRKDIEAACQNISAIWDSI